MFVLLIREWFHSSKRKKSRLCLFYRIRT